MGGLRDIESQICGRPADNRLFMTCLEFHEQKQIQAHGYNVCDENTKWEDGKKGPATNTS